MEEAYYNPPWTDTSIIGVAGSSGSGKTSLAEEIISSLDLPWVVILSMDSFYKPLTPEQHAAAHRNEHDLDAPQALDFDLLVQCLRDLKRGQRANIPVYSFADHQRLEKTTPIYSPHILVLEGIMALHDRRILDMLDLKIFTEADADDCLARRILRDVKERGRDVEGCIKQWTTFVKPNFERYVEPQRKVADVIVPRGMKNRVAIDMIVKHVQMMLKEKSRRHQDDLKRLGQQVEDEPLSPNVLILHPTNQLQGMSTILHSANTDSVDFIFYFDRLACLLIESALETLHYTSKTITTPQDYHYSGLAFPTLISAVVVLRAGSCLETALKRCIPDCMTGRILIQSNNRTGEPELHYLKLPPDIAEHDAVLVLDTQMRSGGAALMTAKVLVDHGVRAEKIAFVTYTAGRVGVNRLCKVFPGLKVVAAEVGEEDPVRWVEKRYFGC